MRAIAIGLEPHLKPLARWSMNMSSRLNVVMWSVLLVVILVVQIMSLRATRENTLGIEELRRQTTPDNTASEAAGKVYLLGDIGRPGTYSLPLGERLTIKQFLWSAIDEPAKANVEVTIRRQDKVGEERDEIHVSLAKIFAGEEPDRFLIPEDLLLVRDLSTKQ